MSHAQMICSALSAAELRHAARNARGRPGMRMLAIANAIEGMSRLEAARLADMSDQALRDAVERYNGEGMAGLSDRPRPGRPSRLTQAQRRELKDIVVAGPDVEREGLSAYTRADIAGIVRERWGVSYDVTSIGRILRDMQLSLQKVRPSHPKKDPAAAEALKKGPRHPAAACRYI